MNIMDEAFFLLQDIFNGLFVIFDKLWGYFRLDLIIVPALFMSAAFAFLLAPIFGGSRGSSDTVKNSKSNKKEK